MIKKIYWLSSYPKSGNTWLRIFLANYIKNKFININDIGFLGYISSSKFIFNKYNNINCSKLSINDRDLMRSNVYQKLNDNSPSFLYNKCHDKYDKNIFSSSYSKGIIYIIRNPLDVVISFSKHYGLSIDDTIKKINNKNHKLSGKINAKQLRQKLGTWSEHVLSWTKQNEIPILIVKYEDMLDNTFNEFEKIIKFLNLDFDKKRLINSINYSSFDFIKKQEINNGFKEKSDKSIFFFNNGIKNNYKNYLNQQQINDIINNNYDIMLKFKYI
jgi:hypothetical protein